MDSEWAIIYHPFISDETSVMLNTVEDNINIAFILCLFIKFLKRNSHIENMKYVGLTYIRISNLS